MLHKSKKKGISREIVGLTQDLYFFQPLELHCSFPRSIPVIKKKSNYGATAPHVVSWAHQLAHTGCGDKHF